MGLAAILVSVIGSRRHKGDAQAFFTKLDTMYYDQKLAQAIDALKAKGVWRKEIKRKPRSTGNE